MRSKDEVAEDLANRHFAVEAGMRRVLRIRGRTEADPGDPIKLLEVNDNTVSAGIQAIQFRPNPKMGIDFPSLIIEVTPEEYEKIESREWRLPEGWEIAGAIGTRTAHCGP